MKLPIIYYFLQKHKIICVIHRLFLLLYILYRHLIIPINIKLSTVFVDFIDEFDILLYNINEGSDFIGFI